MRQQRTQQRTLDQEAFGVQVARQALARRPRRFRQSDLDELARDIPLVGRRVDVQPFVALQADQFRVERGGENLGDFGLAGSGFAFDEQRSLQLQRQEYGRRQLAVGNVVARGKQFDGGVDRCRVNSCPDLSRCAIA